MRNRNLLVLACATLVAAALATPARALTVTGISADWPLDQVGFSPGFVEPTLSLFNIGGERTLFWSGPDETGELASLGFKPTRPPLSLAVDPATKTTDEFAIGTIRYNNFPTNTRGPLDVVLELTLQFDTLGPRTFSIPFEFLQTPDNVLDISSCPAGSTTLCDDIFSLRGDMEQVSMVGGVELKVPGFEDPISLQRMTSILAPENQQGTVLNLIAQVVVPEPATVTLLGIALAAMAWGRSRRTPELPR